MAKKEDIWIVVGHHGAYVDYRYTRKQMKQHHCDTMGYNHFDEAKAKGDKCIKAVLSWEYPVNNVEKDEPLIKYPTK